jgi:anaerobic magnesium-protoporphyrin IX monomethyl ester cyclase
MDLLLTHGYFLQEDPKELQIMKPYPPLGLLYICSHLRQKGFGVEVFDSTFSAKKELFYLLERERPSVVGVYANLMTRANVVEILAVAKSCGWTTVVGGPEPGAYPREYLEAGADVVVNGEGELTLEELLIALRAQPIDSLHEISGIAFRTQDGTVVHTPPRGQIRNLEAQPWPARETIDMDRYVSTWRQHHGMGSVSLITARGCPYHCRWCSHEVFGKTHRRRDPAAVAEELAWLVDRYRPEMAWIADDVFTIHHGWLNRYTDELKLRGLKVPFECISRADRLNAHVVDTLADIGCFRLWIGSESGSQRILDAMERGVTVEQVQNAVALCRSRGIQTGMFLMWGYEGEELVDIEATIEHVKKSNPDVFFTTVAYPIKGTPYYSQIADRVERLKEWRKGSDREVEIRGRRPREFYALADQLLRAEVKLEQLRKSSHPNPALPAIEAEVVEFRRTLHNSGLEVGA